MKYFLAFVGAVVLGYVVLGDWLDSTDLGLDGLWEHDAHRFASGDDEFIAHLPHPWSRTS